MLQLDLTDKTGEPNELCPPLFAAHINNASPVAVFIVLMLYLLSHQGITDCRNKERRKKRERERGRERAEQSK